MLRRLREIDPGLPAGAVPVEARILDYGEYDLVRPDGRPVRRRSMSPAHQRYLVLAAASLMTAVSVWALSQLPA